MNLQDTVIMLFKSIPPEYVMHVGEWNELLLFLGRNPMGQVEVTL